MSLLNFLERKRQRRLEKQKKLSKIIEDVPELLTKVESALGELKDYQSDSELSYRGDKIDVDLKFVSAKLIRFLAHGGKLERELYDRTVTLIRKSSETLKNYPILNLHSQFIKDRESYLNRCATKYQPKLIKSI